MPDRGKKRRIGMPTKRSSAPGRGFGGSQNIGDYGTHAAPRVGGTAQPAASPGLTGATRRQVSRASRLRRKMGTGSAASKQAKRSRRKLY